MEERIDRRLDTAQILGTQWTIKGMRLGFGLARFPGKSGFRSATDQEAVRLHLGLRGDYLFDYKQLGRRYDLIGGHHNLMYSPVFEMEVNSKTPEIETFGVNFSPDTFLRITEGSEEPLQRFRDQVLARKSAILSPVWAALHPAMEKIVYDIVHNAYTGETLQHFLHFQSIELLRLSVATSVGAAANTVKWIQSKVDREKIIAARDYLNSRLSHPPSLMELSKAVGLNEYKLKRGFKETFHSTIFGYLTERRLHLAYRYLRDTQRPVADIAIELGYATPQHFHHAFKQKMGKTPLEARKNPDLAIGFLQKQLNLQ